MNATLNRVGRVLPLFLLLLCAACAANRAAYDGLEDMRVALMGSLQEEGELDVADLLSANGLDPNYSLTVSAPEAELESFDEFPEIPEVVVRGRFFAHDVEIRELVQEAEELLRDVDLNYVFTGKGKNEILRGRPVVFALWNETTEEWTMAHIEIPRPPVRWKPGGPPVSFRLITPGLKAWHVGGTGAERLMFGFSGPNGEPLKVYGRKFPVFDNKALARKQWREVARTAEPIIYLPFTTDALDPGLVGSGRDFLLSTANRALRELRVAKVPSVAYPGQLLADVVPAEVIAMLAVIEQTDDTLYSTLNIGAFEQVMNQYGLQRDNAYRYSVSTASAYGAMQFTNKRGNGTYALVVRRCRGANIDPNFERGATNIYNAMKAAICLLDIELSQMREDIKTAYRNDPALLGIFPIAAYNGGPRNVTRLYNV
ncbi:MAG: hypothetical protein LBE59_12340, partial [Nevskiaceae bacterium]|nr:hypothetical protein [Nevskiaceae bacterium]